ncbi:hypothetical protein QRX50_15800 [Amycolatopsis carbonis]|uniref:Uncharacterized protein n=1 Tax=Amycolatopsis carbonis TaxID=715471 RepID=A0A9Y2ILP5_9PSEU|nr:hypothetical protein [Amycolatopsis sp. 2-15]WIX82112.1 hypothetical protein QRX50_15800 [Amycolatopsis sp. 2-15]
MDDAFTSRLETTCGPVGARPGPTGRPISLDLHPILRDFAHATDSASHHAWLGALTWTAHLDGSTVLVTVTSPDGTSFGFGLPDAPAALLAAAADRLQDFVVEHLRAGLPTCPAPPARPAPSPTTTRPSGPTTARHGRARSALTRDADLHTHPLPAPA